MEPASRGKPVPSIFGRFCGGGGNGDLGLLGLWLIDLAGRVLRFEL